MRSKLLVAAAMLAALTPAGLFAQQTGNDTSAATETQERRSEGQTSDFPWDLLGLIGLAGLAGLRRRSGPDYSKPR
jgi:hypothetical protein